MDIWAKRDKRPVGVEVARLHLNKIGCKLTTLSKEQADYIGVSPQGSFKAEWYRY